MLSVLSNIGHDRYQWQVFGFSTMAKLFNAGGATAPYSVMAVPHVGLYGPPSAINNTVCYTTSTNKL